LRPPARPRSRPSARPLEIRPRTLRSACRDPRRTLGARVHQRPRMRRMDTVHDMGGMYGFGGVDIADADAFHEEWEKRVLGIRIAINLAGRGGGELRPHIESIPPALYLSSRYYERWARALAEIVVESGLLPGAEIEARVEALRSGALEPPTPSAPSREAHARVAARIHRVTHDPADAPARLEVGDTVRVRRMSTPGHTRCPRYVRGVRGTVETVTGGFARPDPGDHPVEQTYTVRFELRDIWGENAEPGFLYLDMWDGYLE
jgi:nitrile hydratase beta subunit